MLYIRVAFDAPTNHIDGYCPFFDKGIGRGTRRRPMRRHARYKPSNLNTRHRCGETYPDIPARICMAACTVQDSDPLCVVNTLKGLVQRVSDIEAIRERLGAVREYPGSARCSSKTIHCCIIQKSRTGPQFLKESYVYGVQSSQTYGSSMSLCPKQSQQPTISSPSGPTMRHDGCPQSSLSVWRLQIHTSLQHLAQDITPLWRVPQRMWRQRSHFLGLVNIVIV